MAVNRDLSNPFPTTFAENDFGMGTVDISLSPTKFIEIGSYTIPAGVGIALGHGADQSQSGAIGRMYMSLKDTGTADINGVVRLEARNPQGRPVLTLFEGRLESLRSSATDRTQQYPLAMYKSAFTEDHSIAILVKPTVAKTFDPDNANNVIRIDATEFTVH